MRTTRVERLAAALVGLEGLGLIALVVWQVVALAGGDTGSIDSSIALIVLSAALAAAVLAFAVAIWRDRSWGRSGGIVTQLLLLAIAGGAVTGAYAEPLVAMAVAVPAVVGLVLLVLAIRDAGRRAGDAASR